MQCSICDDESDLFNCVSCKEIVCENCSIDLAGSFDTCPSLAEAAIKLGLVESKECAILCECCFYETLADIIEGIDDKKRDVILEEMLHELVYFNDDLMDILIFPEEGALYKNPSTFDWTIYNRRLSDPYDIIQEGDLVWDSTVPRCPIIVSSKWCLDGVSYVEGLMKDTQKSVKIKTSEISTVKRSDDTWCRIGNETYNRTVWICYDRDDGDNNEKSW